MIISKPMNAPLSSNSWGYSKRHSNDFSYFDYQKKLIDWGIKIKSDGSFDYFKTINNPVALNIYDSKVKNKPEFKLYQYYSWFNKKPYDEIILRLNEISKTVQANL